MHHLETETGPTPDVELLPNTDPDAPHIVRLSHGLVQLAPGELEGIVQAAYDAEGIVATPDWSAEAARVDAGALA